MSFAADYSEAVAQLNAMTPELYTSPGQPRRKFSLDEFAILLGALDDPQLRFPSVLIAGTNGKGSTAATLASILIASGVRAGLYTSPHLARVNERIRIDRADIADEAFARLFFRVHDAAQSLVLSQRLPQLPSFFEILTAVAFLHFAESSIDLAVLEVGMGGRLDATNIVQPLLSIVTDISLDHMEWLGETIAAIAREKAGILRPDGTLITLPQHPEANQVLGEVASELKVRGVSAVPYMPGGPVSESGLYQVEALGSAITVDSPLAGAHQQRNLALAIAAAVELQKVKQLPITSETIAQGIKTTQWPARLERIDAMQTQWILDVAHNPAGAWALRSGLSAMLPDVDIKTLFFSCLRDKPIAEMAQILFPLFDLVIFAPIHTARAASMDDLLAAAAKTGTAATIADSVANALKLGKSSPGNGPIVISGSVYLVGEARSILLSAQEVEP